MLASTEETLDTRPPPLAMGPSEPSIRFNGYQLSEFLGILANFGSDKLAYVVTPNTDHLIRFYDDPKFRESYRLAEFVLLDSQFLAHVLRFFFSMQVPVCTGSDVTAQLFDKVVGRQDKLVVIGASNEQIQQLVERYGLDGISHHNPPMGFINDPDEVESCLRFVESQSPFRFCLLAVGSPQQELLAQALHARARARGLVLCVGASINFLTGRERRAPYWMQRLGFEWLYRLLQDPKRLAKRYLLRGPRIFFLICRLRFNVARAQKRYGTLEDSPGTSIP